MIEQYAGRFALLRRLGHGGMGEVYLARDLATGAECALKRLPVQGAGRQPAAMRREFEALSRLRHPDVVEVRELGFTAEGEPWVTMEYVPGLPAERAVEPGDWPALYVVAARVLHGLEAIHDAGIVHGDLKPSNVVVVPPESAGAPPKGVRLLDFGLAALAGGDDGGHRGTPGYAAPEVVRGGPATPASDLYGLGALLYRLITGRAAFSGASPSSLLRRQLGGPPPIEPLEEAGAPAGLVSLVLRLLAPLGAERPASAREARRELETLDSAARQPLADRLGAEAVVGREREFARLAHALAGAPRGARLVVLEGEPGAGRSALLRAWAARCTLEGHAVVTLAGRTGAAAGEFARALVARLEAAAGDAPAASSAGEGLAARAAAALGALGGRGATPVVLVDDADRLDPDAEALVRRLALRAGAPAALWVWARRASAGDASLVEGAGIAERIALRGLDRAATERLVAARLLGPAPRALVERVWERSHGHCGLAVELVRAAARSGALREHDGVLVADETALARLAPGEDYAHSVLAAFEAEPAPVRAAGLALAVCGRPVSAARVRALAPQVDDAALEAAARAGIARRDADGAWASGHPALAPRLLARLAPEERRGWHRATLELGDLGPAERFHHLAGAGDVAAALEAAARAFADGAERGLARGAAELAQAHDDPGAAEWWARAGMLDLEAGRPAAAADALERALAAPHGPADRARALERLVVALQQLGRIPESERRIEALAAGRPAADAAAPLVIARAVIERHRGDLGAFERLLARAIELADAADDAESAGAARLLLAARRGLDGRADDAERLAAEAIERLARSDRRVDEIRARAVRAEAVRAARGFDAAEPHYRDTIARARAIADPTAAEEACLAWGNALIEAGRWREARAVFTEALRAAVEGMRGPNVAAAMLNGAQMDALTGHPRAAWRRARAGLALARRHRPRLEPFALRTLALAARQLGAPRRAERLARRAASAAATAGSDDRDWCLIELARGCATEGRWREIPALLERALAAEGAPSVARVALHGFAGRAALRAGDHDAADRHRDAAGRLAGARAAPYAGALALQLRAECELAREGGSSGLEDAAAALAALEALPAPWERALAALDFARLAAGSPRPSRAPVDRWLEDAAAGFERLGDRRGRERALSLRVQWLRRERDEGGAPLPHRGFIEAVSRLLSSMHDLAALAQRAMELAVEQLAAERGVLVIVDHDSGRIDPIAEHGAVDAATRSEALTFSRQVVRRVMSGTGSVLIADAATDPTALSPSMTDLGLRSVVCVPMHARGRVIGAVYLDDTRRPDAFGDDERRLLEGFAELMAIAIEAGRGQAEVRRANELLEEENRSLRRGAGARFRDHHLIGTSSAMAEVLALVGHAARSDAPVLLTGESGSGKELVARILHHGGKRGEGPFVAVNCGALPETLIESELFGSERGAFTGAHESRPGRFVLADRGTLFLDEIGEMPPHQQVKLLRALADREVTPLGGSRPIPVSVRIIAATNADLRRLVEEGRFREDLYYRLAVIEITLPPLRDRKGDIPMLAQHFVAQAAREHELPVPELSPEFMAALMQSDWPGNVRGLQNYIEQAVAMSPGRVLYPNPLPRDLEPTGAAARALSGRRLKDALAALERQMIEEALARAEGNQSRAARELGLTEQTLRYRIERLGLPSIRRKSRPRKKSRRSP